VASLCRDLEEMLVGMPARSAEAVEAGFSRLLGELHSLEQRLIAQTKLSEELEAAVVRLPSPAHAEQRLQEAEERYQWHIEHLSSRDKAVARRMVEAEERQQQFARRAAELRLEVERYRTERIKARKEEVQKMPLLKASREQDFAALAGLKAEIQAQTMVLHKLEAEIPSTRKTWEEHQAISRRLGQLTGESVQDATAGKVI